jgi:hypothetical protein
MLAQGCHAHDGPMASGKLVAIQPFVGTLISAVPHGDQTLDHFGARSARVYPQRRRNRALLEGRAPQTVTALGPVGVRRVNARIAWALARQAHPSNGAREIRKDGRVLPIKVGQAGVRAK